MTRRPDPPARIPHLVAIACWLSLAAGGCGGGQPGSTTGSTGADVTRPTVVATFPSDGATNVSLGTDILIEFSEDIDNRRPSSVISEVTLWQADAGSFGMIDKEVTWEPDSNTLFLKRVQGLEPDTHYMVKVTNNIGDAVGNRLDTGNGDAGLTWRFTTGDTYDNEKPVWRPNRKVWAKATRYDTIVVCWWDGPSQPADFACDPAVVDSLDPAATDNSNGLFHTVLYKRSVDAAFTRFSASMSAQGVILTDRRETGPFEIQAGTEYEIQLTVSDMAGNQADEVLEAPLVETPEAGRLYIVNQGTNTWSVLSNIAQAEGDRAAAVVTANETELFAPTGVAVDHGNPADETDGYVYVADASTNTIAAYKLRSTINSREVGFGEYGYGHNLKPDWTIQGTRTNTDITGLCGPSTLRVERNFATNKSYLYVTNSLFLGAGYPPGFCVPDNILVFDVTQPPQSSNQAPYAVIRNANFMRSPLALAVDEFRKLLYVANRDDATVTDNAGGIVSVFSFTRDPGDGTIKIGQAPQRFFWGSRGGACIPADADVTDRLCGPTAAAYDPLTDKLLVLNRGRNNILVFSNVSSPFTVDAQSPTVVQGPDTGLDNALPVGLFFDPTLRRVYVTTDLGQSVLIFDANQLTADTLPAGGNVPPLRIIKGTKAMLGQPIQDPDTTSRGPFGITVVRNADGVDEAYVGTPAVVQKVVGNVVASATFPSVSVFDVSVARDPVAPSARVTNTPPTRVLVNPLLGVSGLALDRANQRLYVASFHANMILVYDDPGEFESGQHLPDRIIAGPGTLLDHPVSLLYRPETGSLYVVNQSSHSVAVFQEGDGATVPLLSGNVAPVRYLGPPEGADPFEDPFDATINRTELVFPTGIAIDPEHDIMYVSNRDADEFQDLVGRRIVAVANAGGLPLYNPTLGIVATNNIPPTWKIQGNPPPICNTLVCPQPTDKTLLNRPAGLLLIPDGDTSAANDRLVVANRGGHNVLIYRGLSQLVAQAANPLQSPPDDNHAPIWMITHASLQDASPDIGPFGLAYDGGTGHLYVSHIAGRVLGFLLGDLPPNTATTTIAASPVARVIQGAGTGLSQPLGLALDRQLDP